MDSSVLIYMFKADLYFEYIPSMAKVNLPPYTFKYLSYNKHIPIHGSRIFFQPGGGGGVSGIFKSGTTPIPVGEFFRTSSPSTCNPRMFTQSRNHVPMWFYFCGYSHGWKIGVLHLLSLSPSFTGSLIFIYRHPQNDKSWGYILFLFAVSAHAN